MFLRNDKDKNSTVNESIARWYNYERHEKIKNEDTIRKAMRRQKNDNSKMNNIDWEVENFYNDIKNRSFDECMTIKQLCSINDIAQLNIETNQRGSARTDEHSRPRRPRVVRELPVLSMIMFTILSRNKICFFFSI
jgi:hypothetical protein